MNATPNRAAVPDDPDDHGSLFLRDKRKRCHSFPLPLSMQSRSTEGLKVRMTTARSHAPRLLAFRPKRLLRQPGGFDGLLRSGEVSKPKHLAVFELDQPSVRLFDPDAAPLPAKPEPAEDDNVVAGIAPLVPDELPVPELLVDLLHPSMESLSPFERLVLEAADDLEVRVQLIRPKVPVAPVQATEPGLDQLDGLLRHRPPSISRQTVAFHALRKRRRGRARLLLFAKSARPAPAPWTARRSLGGGPEYERLAVAAGGYFVPREQGARAPTMNTVRWAARV